MAKEFAKRFYTSKAWRDCRKQILRRDLYTCAYCSDRAEEVHHVIPIDENNINDTNITLNPDNLISLCHDCHDKITKGFAGDIDEGYIFTEGGQVIRGTSPH